MYCQNCPKTGMYNRSFRVPFISNLKKPVFASKQEVSEIATLWYIFEKKSQQFHISFLINIKCVSFFSQSITSSTNSEFSSEETTASTSSNLDTTSKTCKNSDRTNTMVFYPTLTNFWIVLILKFSEDLALIR